MRTIPIWLLLLVLGSARAGAESEIRDHTLGSGGSVTTPTLALHFTLGQPVAGRVGSAVHQLDAGFWRANPTATAIGAETPTAPHAVDRLHPNVPNPFNPSTTIAYELADEGQVRLSVYDVAGHVVAKLVDRRQAAGLHSVTWRGVNSRGNEVASGVYLFVLDTPHARFARKTVLLR